MPPDGPGLLQHRLGVAVKGQLLLGDLVGGVIHLQGQVQRLLGACRVLGDRTLGLVEAHPADGVAIHIDLVVKHAGRKGRQPAIESLLRP